MNSTIENFSFFLISKNGKFKILFFEILFCSLFLIYFMNKYTVVLNSRKVHFSKNVRKLG